MSKINWNVPKRREGFDGMIDGLIGPGATSAETNLQFMVAAVVAAVNLFAAVWFDLGWSPTQLIIAALINLDMVGGIITNATSTAKRWYHRPGQGIKEHMSFIALHFVQLTVISWAFLSMDWVWVAAVGGFMMAASFAICVTTVYLQRVVSMLLYAVALLLSLYVFETPAGLEWFLPFLFLKLLVSHLPKEEPYRPEWEETQ